MHQCIGLQGDQRVDVVGGGQADRPGQPADFADVAADFLAFFTNPANSAQLAAYFPPARQSQLNANTLAKTNPLLKPDQLQQVVINGISTGVVKPSHTGSAELAQAVRSALDPLWKPDANVKSVLDGVCNAIKPLLGS